MLIAIGYTGMRWGEMIGLERDLLLPTLINVEWQLREIKGRFYRLPPKDDSYRSTSWEPLLPVDLPPFLAGLLTAQADKRTHHHCGCVAAHGGSGRYVFSSPDGGHYRRSNFARRVFRPACDGRYEPISGRLGNLVVVNATAWPGRPVASWPPAVSGKPFAPPSGRGTASGKHGRRRALPGLPAGGEVAPRRDHRRPQDRHRALSGQWEAARRRRSAGLLAADQGRADAPRLAPQPQDMDG
jgi:hypothetical protein